MPDRIRAAVAIQRPIVSGVDLQDDVHDAIARFANAQLYKDPKRIEDMRREVVRLMIGDELFKEVCRKMDV